MDIITRTQAQAQGLKRYFTGKPCKYGHIAERLVGNKSCLMCHNARSRQNYQNDPNYYKTAAISWRGSNPDRFAEIQAKSRAQPHNRKQRVIDARERHNKLISSDPQYALKHRLRTLIFVKLSRKSTQKSAKTFELTGCSGIKLVQHFESLFRDGMSWENMGEWHIDHIIPCSSFDLTDPEQQKQCFHYTNLQPLWAADNLAKSDKLNWQQESVTR